MDDNSEVKLETGDIDWGIEESNADEINFDISLKDAGITVESSGIEGGVAKNNEALTVLDHPNYCEQFLDELFEVNLIFIYSFSEPKYRAPNIHPIFYLFFKITVRSILENASF